MSCAPFVRPSAQRMLLLLFVLALPIFAVAQTAPFAVSLNQTSLTAYPGTAHEIQVQVSSSSGFTDAVVVTLSGLPANVTASPSSLSLTPGNSGVITLTSALNADAPSFPAISGQPNSSTKTITFVGNAAGQTATAGLSFTTSLSNSSFNPDPASTGLPVVQITTNGGVPITSNDVYVPGVVTIVPGATTPNVGYTGTMQVKGHGNSTWGMPKKPYKIKLDSKASLLGMPSNKSWVLLANYDDKTMLRDAIASELSNRLGLPWAPHSGYVELYLNGAYMGTYQLIEQVKVATSRVNITSMSPTDTTGEAVTGGYLLEIDTRQDQAFVFTTSRGVPFGLNDPDFTPDPEIPEQTSYIQNYVQTAEDALYGPNYTDPLLGWQAYFDSNALVNFYLVNEIMGNRDGGRFFSSDYVYKQRSNPLLYMGPVWDFDISSGNENVATIENPTVPWMNVRASWYVQLFTDPNFKNKVVTQWNAVKSTKLDNLNTFIDQAASGLTAAQANNFTRWPILGETVWPNAQALGSHQAEVDFLKTWLNLRIAYLDSYFNGKAQTQTSLQVNNTTPHLGDNVTLTSTVLDVNNTPITDGSITFLAGPLVLGEAAIDGTGTATLSTTKIPLGANAVTAVYHGNATQGLSASTATSVNVAAPLFTTTVQLSTSNTTALQGSSVSFAATVGSSTGTGAPTGTVTFQSGSTTLGSAPVSVGVASASFTTLAVGTDSITATYSGDANYLTSTSSPVSVSITPSQTTATPSFNPPAGTYIGTQSVTISSSTSGAVIHFTTDGTAPSSASPVYSAPISVSSSQTLRAYATATGMNDSPVATAAYTIQPAGTCPAPANPGANVCSPVAGNTYTSPVSVIATGKPTTGSVKRMEVWLDGVKQTQFASATVNTTVNATRGAHRITIVEVDTANNIVKSQVNFTVGVSTGCSAPSTPGVHVCSPLPGSTNSSPVTFTAAATPQSGSVKRLELWIDGKKINNYTGASFTAQVALAAGSHRVVIVEADSANNILKATSITFTVQ